MAKDNQDTLSSNLNLCIAKIMPIKAERWKQLHFVALNYVSVLVCTTDSVRTTRRALSWSEGCIIYIL